MTSALDSYSDRTFCRNLDYLVEWLAYESHPVPKPTAFLLGGQSGAGKTRLHRICGDMLDGNRIVINGDEFRRLHPHFAEIQSRYGMDAPAHTAKWAGEMTEALIDAFSQQRYNLIVEGTLRTSAVPLKTADLLRERGYEVSLAIMAVKPEISLVSCQIRYEEMRLAGTTPRSTDPVHHDKIVHDIVENLSVLEESGRFESVLLYNRAGAQLYPSAVRDGTASEALREALFGSWSSEEQQHFEHLQQRLAELKSIVQETP